jgi:CPA1 family monovalent cation:H+ antiporter
MAARFGWLFTTPYMLRALDRRPQQRARRLSSRPRAVLAVANFRGAVSLAAVLALPRTLDSGQPISSRDLLVFVVAVVIAATLAQGLLLPAVVRWARLPADTTSEQELALARRNATADALTALPELAQQLGTSGQVLQHVQQEYEQRLCTVDQRTADAPSPPDEHAALRLALIARRRATVVRLRDEGQIDDDVLRQLQGTLDHEELRLSRREPSG